MMMNDETPVHPFTGLRALAVIGGRPVWPVLGGDGTGDGDTGQGDGDNAGDGQGDGDGTSEGDDDGGQGGGDEGDESALGDAGKKALTATKEKWKAERERRKRLERELEEARKGSKGDDEPDAEQIRRDAEQAATAKANARIVRAELRAAAAGKLADPSDVAVFLDPAEFEVDEHGEIDPDEVNDAIADLLARKPHLAAGGGRRFQGGGDGGAGRGSKPKSLDAQIREAEARGDLGTSLRLKQAKLAEARKKNSQ